MSARSLCFSECKSAHTPRKSEWCAWVLPLELQLICAWCVLCLCTRCNMLILCTNTIVRNLCTKFMHKVAQKDVTLLVCLVQSALTQTKLTAIRHNYICRQSFHFRHQPTILRVRKARFESFSLLKSHITEYVINLFVPADRSAIPESEGKATRGLFFSHKNSHHYYSCRRLWFSFVCILCLIIV